MKSFLFCLVLGFGCASITPEAIPDWEATQVIYVADNERPSEIKTLRLRTEVGEDGYVDSVALETVIVPLHAWPKHYSGNCFTMTVKAKSGKVGPIVPADLSVCKYEAMSYLRSDIVDLFYLFNKYIYK